MGLLTYKISEYNTTAEREQYRAVCNVLHKKYSTSDKLCLFIANYNIYDSEFDGIIIKEDAIIALEFKNYGGSFTAVENGDWKLDDGTVIKGGSRKTPYQQAKINHIQLRNGLIDGKILPPNQVKDIPALILFNHPICCDNKLSGRVRSWLHIADMEHFIEKVEDITTRDTYLTNSDILQLIPKLALSDDFLESRFSSSQDKIILTSNVEDDDYVDNVSDVAEPEAPLIENNTQDPQLEPVREMVKQILNAVGYNGSEYYVYSHENYGREIDFEREYVVIVKSVSEALFSCIKRFLRRDDVYFNEGLCHWFEGVPIDKAEKPNVVHTPEKIAHNHNRDVDFDCKLDTVFVPDWLQSVIYDNLHAVYAPDHKKYETNLSLSDDELLVYLGTYFPRSYGESFSIWDSLFSRCNYSHFFAKESISVLGLGVGTGGDIIGLLDIIHKYGLCSKVQVYAIDGNKKALSIFQHLVAVLASRYNMSIKVECYESTVDGGLSLPDIGTSFDVITTSKFVNEIVNILNEPYYKILEYSYPKLAQHGLMLISDVTTLVEDTFIPVRMNAEVNKFVRRHKACKSILPIACSQFEQQCTYQCFTQKQINISHRYRALDKSLITYRLLGRKDLASDLSIYEDDCIYVNTYKAGDNDQVCPFTTSKTIKKYNL
jgi:hypothetical protein